MSKGISRRCYPHRRRIRYDKSADRLLLHTIHTKEARILCLPSEGAYGAGHIPT